MSQAIELSRQSVGIGGYPVGAIITMSDQIIAKGLSNGKQLFDATSHAEISAIRTAGVKLKKRNLSDVVLYTSLEPCVMCASASFWAYIPKIVFACRRTKVSKDHYEGNHDIFKINMTNRRQIQYVHLQALEEEALKVITDWERIKNRS